MFLHQEELYKQLSVGWLLFVVSGALVAYHAFRAIYLIYFSPLSVFPGSKWAALGE